MIVVNPLAKHPEQSFERLRLVAHRNDRASEGLGFLAPGATEHQPDEPEQG